jgi:hypothetical protein
VTFCNSGGGGAVIKRKWDGGTETSEHRRYHRWLTAGGLPLTQKLDSRKQSVVGMLLKTELRCLTVRRLDTLRVYVDRRVTDLLSKRYYLQKTMTNQAVIF